MKLGTVLTLSTLSTTLSIVPCVTVLTSPAVADLPRSLNFENQTSGRINPNQAEGSSNEKEVEFGDLDNDGDLDVIVAVGSADFGERKNKVYINEGGVFNEQSGVLIPEFAMEDVSRNAFIRDYTGDEWNDIYIINDSNSGGFAGTDKIYIAQHAAGKLTGYSQENAARIPFGGDLGAACGGISYDLDGNGTQDVYSGNYPGPSQDRGLYNPGTGFLTDVTASMVPQDSDYTVDVALGDMNGDGKMDLLISNDFDPNFVYYNDKNGAGSGLGDFQYADSTQSLGTAGAGENAMEAADFDGDGDLDIYWTNRVGSGGDRILRNDGNDGSNKAVFTTLTILPTTVTANTSRKATVADFNDDGRIDVFVASQSGGRPTVLRNTSVNNVMSFVDWAPAPAFPAGAMLRGWHGAAFDTGGDGDLDILIGAFSGDHLLENVPANEVNEGDLGPGLPSFFNGDPVAVTGIAGDGDVDVYAADGLGSGLLSVVLNGPDDYRLEVLNSVGTPIATSDRGGLGIEEAVQVSIGAGDHSLRVTVLEAAGGGGCPAADIDGDCMVGFADILEVLSNWGCTGCPADLDGGGAGFSDLLQVISTWGETGAKTAEYLLEILGRS